MKTWMTIIFITFILSSPAQIEMISSSTADSIVNTKSKVIDDDPFLEMIDSLHEAQLFNKKPISYNIRDLNIHKLPLDSIPVYSDSVL